MPSYSRKWKDFSRLQAKGDQELLKISAFQNTILPFQFVIFRHYKPQLETLLKELLHGTKRGQG